MPSLSLMWFYVLSNVYKYFMWCEALMVRLVPLLNKSSISLSLLFLFLLLLQLLCPKCILLWIHKKENHFTHSEIITMYKSERMPPPEVNHVSTTAPDLLPQDLGKMNLSCQWILLGFLQLIKILFTENLYWHCKWTWLLINHASLWKFRRSRALLDNRPVFLTVLP